MEQASVRALVDALGADDTILEETLRTLRESLPGYDQVPTESLLASARRNRALSMRTLLDGRAPDPAEIEEPRTLMEERMGQGIPIVSVLAGFRLSMSVILRHLLELAPRFGVSADTALTFSTQLWALGDAFTTRAVQVYQDRSIAQAVADSNRRTQWIRDAVVGVIDRAGLIAGAASFEIPVDRPVRVVRVAVGPEDTSGRAGGPTPDAAAELNAWAERTGARVLAAPRGSGAVGILVDDAGRGRPAPGVTVAVGPPVLLEDLAESFEAASRVLEAALRVGWDGVVDAARLSWRMAIPASPETTELLHDRHVAPLLEEGAFGELLLEALDAYLAHGLSIPLAAAAIPVHVNTLRYRLKRYQEITGSNVHDPETLIEASWAIAAHHGDRRHPAVS